MIDTPHIVAWETTRRCVLNCRHCRGGARDRVYDGELTTAEGLQLIAALASYGKPLLILTGGEPMSRPDIYDLASQATAQGLRVVMAPCGALLTPATAARLPASGVRRISLSLDGVDAATHDTFRGTAGAFAAALRGCACAREAGLAFQVNATVSRANVNQLPAIVNLAASLGAAAVDFFFLVPTGRGAALRELALSPAEHELALAWIVEAAAGSPIPIRTTCAPQVVRVAARCGPATHGSRLGGCLAGRGFLFISHRGIVQPCGFLQIPCGDLRAARFDLAAICRTSAVLHTLRNPDLYRGRCGRCDYRHACGGCRGRAYEEARDWLAEEPSCAYEPPHTEGTPV